MIWNLSISWCRWQLSNIASLALYPICMCTSTIRLFKNKLHYHQKLHDEWSCFWHRSEDWSWIQYWHLLQLTKYSVLVQVSRPGSTYPSALSIWSIYCEEPKQKFKSTGTWNKLLSSWQNSFQYCKRRANLALVIDKHVLF